MPDPVTLPDLLQEALRLANIHDFEALDGILARIDNRLDANPSAKTPAVNAALAEVFEVCKSWMREHGPS